MKTSKLFKGKETYSEELKEGKAIKSGKVSPKQYAEAEMKENEKRMKRGGKVKKFAVGGVVPDMRPDKPEGKGVARGTGAATRGKIFNGVY